MSKLLHASLFYLLTYIPQIMPPDDHRGVSISLASEEKKPVQQHQPMLGQPFNSVSIPGSSALRTEAILAGPMFCMVHAGTGSSTLQLG